MDARRSRRARQPDRRRRRGVLGPARGQVGHPAAAGVSVTSPPTTEERIATATLLRIAEPGVPSLTAYVREHGVLATVEAVRQGAPIGALDVEGLRHRLAGASAERDNQRAPAVGGRVVWPGGPARPKAPGGP